MRKNTLFGNIEEKNYSFKREKKKKDRRERNFNFVSDRLYLESFLHPSMQLQFLTISRKLRFNAKSTFSEFIEHYCRFEKS